MYCITCTRHFTPPSDVEQLSYRGLLCSRRCERVWFGDDRIVLDDARWPEEPEDFAEALDAYQIPDAALDGWPETEVVV